MSCTNISSKYENRQEYALTEAANGIPPRQEGTASSRNNAAVISAGDTVVISNEAREVAAQQPTKMESAGKPDNCDQIHDNISYFPVKNITTSDGSKLNIDAAYSVDKNGHQQVSSVRVNITGSNGEVKAHVVDASSILSQNESGEWIVKSIEENSVTGSDKDDIVILLPTGKKLSGVTDNGIRLDNFSENKTDIHVDAGEGNNVVMDFSGEKTEIITGSGNDIIIGSSANGCYVVKSGAGNDTIELAGSASYVYAGEGDDNITLNTTEIKKVSAEAGDDSIVIKGNTFVGGYHQPEGEGVIDGGDGDDRIHFEQSARGTVLGGSGNDVISYDGSESNVYINGGDGDDVIRGEGRNGTQTIEGGNGNDTMNNIGGTAHINGGNGNDAIHLGTGSNFFVSGGNNNDYIKYSANGGSYYINGGDGDDTIEATINGGLHYITGGRGDNTIATELLGGGYAFIANQILDNAPIAHDERVGLIQARINEMRAERKKTKVLSDDPTLKDISKYDEYIANSSMGLNRKETSKSQGEMNSEAEFRKVSAAATEIRHQQFRNFQRAIVAYEQQGHTIK